MKIANAAEQVRKLPVHLRGRSGADGGDIPQKTAKSGRQNSKSLRESRDPWKLKSAATKGDYRKMLAPSLEMFCWSRIIIDEYTYIDGIDLSMISRLTASRTWALSGTSPTKDFHALRTMARFLNIHLGIHDSDEIKSKTALKKNTEESSRTYKLLCRPSSLPLICSHRG